MVASSADITALSLTSVSLFSAATRHLHRHLKQTHFGHELLVYVPILDHLCHCVMPFKSVQNDFSRLFMAIIVDFVHAIKEKKINKKKPKQFVMF